MLSVYGNSSNQILVLDLLENKGAAALYCENNIGCRVVMSETTRFSNENLFVRLESKVANHNIRVLFPETVEAESLFEALIKVRTLKTEGALSVEVLFEAEVPAWTKSMFKVAGADRLISANGNDLKVSSFEKPSNIFLQPTAKVHLVSANLDPFALSLIHI